MAYGDMGDLAVLDLERSPIDLSKQGAGGAQPGAASDDLLAGRSRHRRRSTAISTPTAASTGRARPVHLTSLVRDREAKAVADRKGYDRRQAALGAGVQALSRSTATPGGALATDVELPKTAPRGHWTAELHDRRLQGPGRQTSTSRCEDFVPQRLAVTADGQAAGPGRRGRDPQGRCRRPLPLRRDRRRPADPGRGAAARRPQSRSRPSQDYQWGDETTPFDEKEVDLGTTVTDGAGHASLDLAGSAGRRHASIRWSALVTASVFEPGGRPVRESVTLKVRPKPLYLGVKVDQGDASGERAAAGEPRRHRRERRRRGGSPRQASPTA